ncbi:hypothetical protein MU469_14190, partial [Staphylococcus aureus]|uniref:hypothetical protein n=1 Tax=Staphylococcus aureus TaxID=1280 RepID=UPI001FD1BFF6
SVAVISLPTFNSVPSGTSTVQLPFSSTLLVAVFPSGNVTVTAVSYTHLKKKNARYYRPLWNAVPVIRN